MLLNISTPFTQKRRVIYILLHGYKELKSKQLFNTQLILNLLCFKFLVLIIISIEGDRRNQLIWHKLLPINNKVQNKIVKFEIYPHDPHFYDITISSHRQDTHTTTFDKLVVEQWLQYDSLYPWWLLVIFYVTIEWIVCNY